MGSTAPSHHFRREALGLIPARSAWGCYLSGLTCRGVFSTKGRRAPPGASNCQSILGPDASVLFSRGVNYRALHSSA
ncbi:hypothetical protein SKAU_G00040140 [Synaphobranchus kaupii]|uniref:Uncharacterized protein n=1 Tax=Synaphobranchus kaupii TaxID=118154 RepID=A0A9Q1G1X8_SYNKA|nr:hypothetical protein SKAU_G00040140 [Synaphobranchus kaupii]